MAIEYPFDTRTSEWDVLVLDDIIVPGVARVNKVSKFDFEIGKNQGTDGAPITYKGMQPRKLTATVTMTTKDEFDRFLRDVAPRFNVRGDLKAERPIAFGHPQGQAWGIREVHIEGIDAPAPDAASGWVVTFSLLEHTVARPAKTGPKKTASQQGLTPRAQKPTGQVMR